MPIAFPTAEGFGVNAIGGRGGVVRKVTTLADSGAGSFREAVMASGPRIVVFAVSGTIQILSQITVSNPYLTIAGQTSPGGVQIRGTLGTPTGLMFGGGIHDVIIRHLRVRIGGREDNDNGEEFIIYGWDERQVYNIIVDHCDIMWGHEGMFMAYSNWDRITCQWSLIAEAICDNTGDPNSGREGAHIGGILDMSAGSVNGTITMHHNAMVSCHHRNPNMTRARIFDFRNNVVYNYNGTNGMRIGQSSFAWSARGNVVNNIWLAGPDTSGQYCNVLDNGGTTLEGGGTRIYTTGNWGRPIPTGAANDWPIYKDADQPFPYPNPSESLYRTLTPFTVPAVTTHATSALIDIITANVGARKPTMDSATTGMINDIINNTGAIPAATSNGGPWPTLTGGAPPTDSNNDGIPDAWATAHGVTAANDTSPSGWTWIEDYLNELAGDTLEYTEPPPPSSTAKIVQIGPLASVASGGPLILSITGVKAGNSLVYAAVTKVGAPGPSFGAPTNSFLEDKESGSNNNARVVCGSRHACPAGDYTVQMTLTAAAAAKGRLLEISGIKAQTSTNAAIGTSAAPSVGPATPAAAGAYMIGVIANPQAAATMSPDTTQGWATIFKEEDVSVTAGLSVISKTGTAADSAAWTFSASRIWTGVIAAYELQEATTPTTQCRAQRLQAGNRYGSLLVGRHSLQNF